MKKSKKNNIRRSFDPTHAVWNIKAGNTLNVKFEIYLNRNLIIVSFLGEEEFRYLRL